MGRPSSIPLEQRTELVLAVLRRTEKLEVLARRHQVSANTLRKWRDEFVTAGQERLSGRGDTAAAQAECKQLQRELAERELIIGELTVAQRFLQKKGSSGISGKRRPYFEEEVVIVSEAVGHSFDHLDFVHDALQQARVQRILAVGQDAVDLLA